MSHPDQELEKKSPRSKRTLGGFRVHNRLISHGPGAASIPLKLQSGRRRARGRSSEPVPLPRSSSRERRPGGSRSATAATVARFVGYSGTWVRKLVQYTASSSPNAARYQPGATSSRPASTSSGTKPRWIGSHHRALRSTVPIAAALIAWTATSGQMPAPSGALRTSVAAMTQPTSWASRAFRAGGMSRRPWRSRR